MKLSLFNMYAIWLTLGIMGVLIYLDPVFLSLIVMGTVLSLAIYYFGWSYIYLFGSILLYCTPIGWFILFCWWYRDNEYDACDCQKD